MSCLCCSLFLSVCLKSGHMSCLCCSLFLGVCLKLGLQFCLFLLLGSQCLRICRSFLSCIFHSLLIIFLSILLLGFGLSHLLCEVLNHEVDHRYDAIAFLRLLGECGCRLGRWRWCRMVRNSSQDSHTGARNSTWSRCWCQSATHVDSDLLLLRELALWRCLVQFGIIKLIQTILCEAENFFGCTIASHQFGIFCILLLPLLSSFCNRLIQGFDACFESLDLLREGLDAFVCLVDRLLKVRNFSFESLLLVICQIELRLTVFFFVVVILLFGSQCFHHLIDHSDNLTEIHLPSLESQCDEVKLGATICSNHCKSLLTLISNGHLQLQQACTCSG